MDVRYEAVSKSFGSTEALAPLDLTCPTGVSWPSSGLPAAARRRRCACWPGSRRPTGGRLYIGERDVTFAATKDRDIAMVFQSYALYPHLKVADNIAYPLRVRKVDPAERDKQVRKVAELLGLEDYLERRPGQLSGGQRQRVALARAIIRRPQAFLMDEPLSNLDAQLRLQMRIEIKRLQRELKATMLYVTHDQVEAMTMADRIAVMQRREAPAAGGAGGALCAAGEPLRRHLLRLAADEHPRRRDRGRRLPPRRRQPALAGGKPCRPGQARLSPGACDARRGGGQRSASRRDLCRRAARQRDARHDHGGGCARQHPPAGGFLDAHRQPLRGPARRGGTCICSTTRPEKRSRQRSDHIRPAETLIRPTQNRE